MNKIKLLQLIFIFMLCSSSGVAGEMTILDAVNLALEHSHQLKSSAAQTKALEASYRASIGERFPTLSALATATWKSDIPEFDLAVPGLPPIQRNFGSKESYQSDLKLSLPLFTGGRIGGNIGASNANYEMQKAFELKEKELLIYQTRISYLDLIKTDKLLNAAKASFERAKVTEKDVSSKLAQGAADSVDLNEAKIQSANAQFSLRRSETDRKSAEIVLLMLLGLPPSENVEAADILAIPDTSKIERSSINKNKPELLAASANVKHSESLVKVARSDILPNLSAFATYSYGKPNNDPFNSTWNDYFTVGGALSWSFNLGLKSAYNIRSAKYFVNAYSAQRDEINENLQRQAELAWENLKLAFERYEITSNSFRLASANYELAREQYNQGVLTSNRLLDNQTALSAKESEMASALADYHMALVTYYYQIGSDKLMEGIN